MDPGYFILFLFMIIEGVLVVLMVMPMPSNNARRTITDFVAGLWEYKPVHYTAIALLLLDAFYFCFIFDALLHPLYDFGILTPVDVGVTCEIKAAMFREERNAFITGMGLFLFFILNRLVDIQDKLHQFRHEVKEAANDKKEFRHEVKEAANDKKEFRHEVKEAANGKKVD